MHKYKIYLHIMHKWRIIMQKRGEGNAFTEGRSDYERHWKNEEYEPAFTNWQNMSPSVKKTYTRA